MAETPRAIASGDSTLAGLGPSDVCAPRSRPRPARDEVVKTLHGLGVEEDAERPTPPTEDWRDAQRELVEILQRIEVGPRAACDARGVSGGAPPRGWPPAPRMVRRLTPPRQPAAQASAPASPVVVAPSAFLGWVHPAAWMCLIVAALALGFGLGRL